ncbi:MAG: XRE family transcriptional regulator [Solirubrobacterales bacterium]
MKDTTAWVANALRGARETRGWNQSELAKKLGVTQTAISYWEGGKRSPGLDDLIMIAEALDVPVFKFIPPSRAQAQAPALLRATAARLADSDLQESVARLTDMAEGVAAPSPELQITSTNPSNAANELIEKAAVTTPPVPVKTLAERCGALVYFQKYPDSLSGLVFALDDAAVIGINEGHPRVRQRFSLGHELGHYVLRHLQRQSGYEDRVHIDSAEGVSPGFDWRAERAANEFAAELLMPRKFVSQAHANAASHQELADKFEVSELAMGYRLVNLGLR